MAKKKKKKMTGGLKNRYKTSYETKDKGIGVGAFDWKKVEGTVSFFKPKEKKNRFNIIPYEIKSKNHPLVKSGDAEIGELDYKMDIFLHKSVGPNNASIVCPKKNFAKPCPVCEMADELRDKGKEKEFSSIKAKRRVLYNVQQLDKSMSPVDDNGVQVFEVSHNLFEKEMIEEAREVTDNGDIVEFADPEDGKVVVFRASETSIGKGGSFLEYKSFQFIDREEEISDAVFEEAISFDDIMVLLSYEEIEDVLYGKDEDEEEEEEKPKKSSKKSKKPEPDEDEDEEDEDSDEPDEDEEEEDNESEDEEEEDEEEEEKPKKSSKKSKVPTKKSKKGSDKGKCPHGHTYHEDNEEYDDCENCDVWDDCARGV